MTVVWNVEVEPGGAPAPDLRVVLELVSAPDGWSVAAGTRVLGSAPTRLVTDAAGRWEADLPPNAALEPEGTYYRATVTGPGPSDVSVAHFVVPADPGPLWIFDLLVVPPPPLPAPMDVINEADFVHRAGSEEIVGDKDFTGALLAGGVPVAVETDPRFADARAPLDGSVVPGSLAPASVALFDPAGAAAAALAGAIAASDPAGAAAAVKADLLGGAGAAYDTLGELQALLGDSDDAVAALTVSIAATAGDLAAHLGDLANPHATTAAQVGADPAGAAAAAQAAAIAASDPAGSAAAAQAAAIAAASAGLGVHTDNHANPHATTAAQVGADPAGSAAAAQAAAIAASDPAGAAAAAQAAAIAASDPAGAANAARLAAIAASDPAGAAAAAQAAAIAAAAGALAGHAGAANHPYLDAVGHWTAAQTFDAIVVPDDAFAQAKVAGLVAGLAAKATDTAVVHKAGGDLITASATNVIPLVLKLAASQTANAFEVRDSAGTATTFLTATGGGILAVPRLLAYGNSASVVPLVTRATTGQTSNLFEVQDAAAAVLASITSTGTAALRQTVAQTAAAGSVALVAKGAASQSANLFEAQSSAGTAVAWITAAGTLATTNKLLSTAGADTGARGVFGSSSTGQIGVSVQAFASQTARLVSFRNSGNSEIGYIGSNAFIYTPGVAAGADVYYNASLNVIPPSTSQLGIVVRCQASQSASLTEWQDSAGGVLAKQKPNGEYEQLVAAVNASDAGGGAGGVVLKSPNGTRWRLTISNTGVPTTIAA